jgi:polysaccharide pyruvyl transferase WcaK-like protein
MIKRIHIIGFHDARNKGDLAILESEIQALKDEIPNVEISVCATYPESLAKIHSNLLVYPPLIDLRISHYKSVKSKIKKLFYPVIILEQIFLSLVSTFFVKFRFPFGYRLETLKRFKEADLIIATGGGYLKEGFFTLPQTAYSKVAHLGSLIARAFEIIVSKRVFRKFVVLFPQSIGPFRTKFGRFILRVILANVDAVILREQYSLEMLKAMKLPTRLYVTGDVALLLDGKTSTSNKLFIGVCPRVGDFDNLDRNSYVLAHSKVLDYLVENLEAEVFFLPSNITPGLKDDDLSVCLEIQKNMIHRNRSKILALDKSEDLMFYIEQLQLLLTTRLHAGILAALENVPFLFIVCEHKQIGFLRQLDLEDVALEIQNLTSEMLLSKTLYVLTESKRVRRQLALRIPALREHVRMTIKLVLSDLLDEEPSIEKRE